MMLQREREREIFREFFSMKTRVLFLSPAEKRGHRGRDHIVFGFTTTYAISAYPHKRCEFESRSGDVYSIQHFVIKFVSDLQQVDGFHRVFEFPPPIKLTATI